MMPMVDFDVLEMSCKYKDHSYMCLHPKYINDPDINDADYPECLTENCPLLEIEKEFHNMLQNGKSIDEAYEIKRQLLLRYTEFTKEREDQ